MFHLLDGRRDVILSVSTFGEVLSSKVLSFEQMRRAVLYGIFFVTCGGWQLEGSRYWCFSVGLEYISTLTSSSIAVDCVSRKT